MVASFFFIAYDFNYLTYLTIPIRLDFKIICVCLSLLITGSLPFQVPPCIFHHVVSAIQIWVTPTGIITQHVLFVAGMRYTGRFKI
jgi:hypothetical protein